jgi:DNA-binding LytR/AlgR family response regulator
MNDLKLTCLIIDDEPLARKGLEEYVQAIGFLHLAGVCENAMKASTYLLQQPVDLLFLDIHLPKISGIEFLKALKNPPMAIFTTAYSEHAVEGYSLDVMDYLVKPITFDRFMKAAQKALDFYQLRRRAERQPLTDAAYFFVKCDSKFEKVFFDDVKYIEAMQNYSVIHIHGRKLITYITLTSLEKQLPGHAFLKVHKSYLISIAKIKAIEGNEILIGEARIPISRSLKDEVMNMILGNNLFKR